MTRRRQALDTPPNLVPTKPHRQQQNLHAGMTKLEGGGEAVVGGSMTDLTPIADGESGHSISPNLGSRLPDIVATAVNLVPSSGAIDPRANRNAAPVRRYVVKAEKQVSANGHRFKLLPGKIIDEQNYDVPALRKQGVVLEDYVETVVS